MKRNVQKANVGWGGLGGGGAIYDGLRHLPLLQDCKFLVFLQTDLVIWHAWRLHSGVFGDPDTILENWKNMKGRFEVQY